MNENFQGVGLISGIATTCHCLTVTLDNLSELTINNTLPKMFQLL
jgi:hypothetical protein